jgi:hypothetical protein
MNLTHGLTAKGLNYWEDDSKTHLIQQTATRSAIYVYYRNHLVIDCGTPKGLASQHGFTLLGKEQTKPKKSGVIHWEIPEEAEMYFPISPDSYVH